MDLLKQHKNIYPRHVFAVI